jgi:hypothetical protein
MRPSLLRAARLRAAGSVLCGRTGVLHRLAPAGDRAGMICRPQSEHVAALSVAGVGAAHLPSSAAAGSAKGVRDVQRVASLPR